LLGAVVAVGRTFVKEDGSAYWSSQVILSDAFWKRRFGGDRAVLGHAVTIDGQVVTIVGVMPPGFWISPAATKVDVWRALNLDSNPAIAGNRHNRYLQAMARLKPGITMEQAQVEMATIASRLALAYPQTNTGWTVQLLPLHEAFFGGHRSVLYSLLMAVGFVSPPSSGPLLLTETSPTRIVRTPNSPRHSVMPASRTPRPPDPRHYRRARC
jgi:putative ABC transport system permease protein